MIERFLKILESLFDTNKLDLNWSKTYFMFTTRLPHEILINSKTTVQVVKTFKLLGITLENKLDFVEHCSILKKIFHKKLLCTKRLFFLATSVKIHFLKIFILPYFDYCLLIIIFFSKNAVQSLKICFNFCLLRLSKISPDTWIYDEDDENKMDNFLTILQSYDIFTLQSRILSFTHWIKIILTLRSSKKQ